MTDYGEPWKLDGFNWVKTREDKWLVNQPTRSNEHQIDYERIVACVNACQVIPSEALKEVLRLLVWSKLARVDSETCKTQGLGPAICSDLEKAAALIKQYGGSWKELT